MIPKGRQEVTCKECLVSGTVYVGRRLSAGAYKIEDFIKHTESCPLYQREQPKHLQRKDWRKQEKRANALVGARETVASGALGEDGDGRKFHEWRVESKQTTGRHYNLRQDVWHKLVHGALINGEEPILHVELNIATTTTQRLVVMRQELYEALSGDSSPPCNPGQENRVSWRIEYNIHPHEIRLEPVGVVVTEAEFKRLKERM